MVNRPRTAPPAFLSQSLPLGPVTAPVQREVYSVSRLTREIKRVLDTGMGAINLEAEISNLTQHSSGHWYFSLKDEQSQIRCVMWRAANQRVRTPIRAGMKVVARGHVSLYESRGECQFVVEHMEEGGEGALRRQFEDLKARLQAEGLFDPARKRPLPRVPQRIGVVTSPTGAALQDILQILARRFPAIPVLLYPAPVQGPLAAPALTEAVKSATQRIEVDVLIIARGGGSMEDLWAFNDEALARAIAACPMPVISGVGHEIDYTISDYVADVRAPTPSGAAELAVPDAASWLRALKSTQDRLSDALARRVRSHQDRIQQLIRRLQFQQPGVKISAHWQRLDELQSRIERAIAQKIKHSQADLSARTAKLHQHSPQAALIARHHTLQLALNRLTQSIRFRLREAQGLLAHQVSELRAHSPIGTLAAHRQQVENLNARLVRATTQRLQTARGQIEATSRALNAVSPLATLDRGYAIVLKMDGSLVRSGNQIELGEHLTTRLATATITSQILAIRNTDDSPSN